MICSRSQRHRLATVIGILITCSSATAYSNTIQPTDYQLSGGPIIISPTNEITLQNGQNFSLLCKYNKPIRLKQQPIPEEFLKSDFNAVERNVTSPDLNYKYAKSLDLYNVDYYAVGYYACFDDTFNETDVLTNITDELNNTDHISYIYIYVNGSERIFAPMREIILARSRSKVIIGCRPTSPDIKVNIKLSNNTQDYLKFSPKIGFLMKKPSPYQCEGQRGNLTIKRSITYKFEGPPKPNIQGIKYFLDGETFSLNCTVVHKSNVPTVLTWEIPRNHLEGVRNHTNEQEVGDILYSVITIENAKQSDAGNYICNSKNGPEQKHASFQKVFTDHAFINMTKGNKNDFIETHQKVIRLHTTIKDYPRSTVLLYKDEKELPQNIGKYFLDRDDSSLLLTIKNFTVEDTGLYTLVASNQYVSENVTYDLRRTELPKVDFGPERSKSFLINTIATLRCKATGYPLPNITWVFDNKEGGLQEIPAKEEKTLSKIYLVSEVQISVRVSGQIKCRASNNIGSSQATKEFHVYEVANGFGIRDPDNNWFPEGEKMQLTCLASKYEYRNLTWLGNDYEELFEYVHYFNTPFSYMALLEIDNISLEQEGNYTCEAIKKGGPEESETIVVTIEAQSMPVIKKPVKDENLAVNPYQPIQFNCEADAVPPPVITWHKDGLILRNNTEVDIINEYLDHMIVNSSVVIKQMSEDNIGKYECVATSGGHHTKRVYNLLIKEKSTNMPIYLSICGVVAFLLIFLVVYLAWKIRKEKQFRKELAAAGLLYFNEGVTQSLNPEIGIAEQAELLPYKERFEFPPEKLILGAQLGAGAFGVVYKAEARGIINAEETTPVAVKMVKKNADNMYIKALASELKIMVHLGKHVNIVNLLGACTQNVGKRELIVIVEYCKFGNIHNYMRRHREVFIDQLTDNKEKNFGNVNRAFSCSSGNSGMHSEYFGSNHTQDTDHTFINTANTSRSMRKDQAPQTVEMVKVSENGYVAPEWRSNYESDYSFDVRNPRPLTSRDLLAWAFQIARGMEYLVNRKVLHGDLAARNILLAEDNIVKICDFGLARSICKNSEYQKKGNSPLPVKWLAVECMTDRIFSTQSDVWSFGIVLWELFSLAKTPYPNISPQNLLTWLTEGHRLEKPPYANDKLYDLMRRCWEERPTSRPSFSQLQEILGSFLEENVRNHYVDLNSPYMAVSNDGEDYLAMMCAPDYNNMVSPSDHHYANDSRVSFPSKLSPIKLEHDDEGYLQMTNLKFSPRNLCLKSEATEHGSELTPMLTLSSLPARSGSESDHDGNSSPYLKMCPRIIEENDEVFETKQNIKNTQNTAVSNPTYTTFDVDLDKKPNNISNNYINVSAPNGLVK